MASYAGGTVLSKAFHWFCEEEARQEAEQLRQCVGCAPTLAPSLCELYRGLPTVSGSVLCFGCNGYIGEAVVFEAVRRGLVVSVFTRQQSLSKFEAVLEELHIKERVTLIVGELTSRADLERAFQISKPKACMCLAGCMVMDHVEQFTVDYQAMHELIEVSHVEALEHFIFFSAYEVYQPVLPTQFHKLRIEGELMRFFANRHAVDGRASYGLYATYCELQKHSEGDAGGGSFSYRPRRLGYLEPHRTRGPCAFLCLVRAESRRVWSCLACWRALDKGQPCHRLGSGKHGHCQDHRKIRSTRCEANLDVATQHN